METVTLETMKVKLSRVRITWKPKTITCWSDKGTVVKKAIILLVLSSTPPMNTIKFYEEDMIASRRANGSNN